MSAPLRQMFRAPLEIFPWYKSLYSQNPWQMNWFMVTFSVVSALAAGKGAEKLVCRNDQASVGRKLYVLPFWMSDYRSNKGIRQTHKNQQ